MNRYEWNRSLVEVFTSMSLAGIAYDTHGAKEMRSSLTPRAWAAQAQVDKIAGIALPPSINGLMEMVAKEHCHSVKLRTARKPIVVKERIQAIASDGSLVTLKNGKPRMMVVKRAGEPMPITWAMLLATANNAGHDAIARARALAEGEQTPASMAELASIVGVGVNVESPDQVIALLDKLGLPAKFKRGARVDGDDEAGRTSDEEALLDLFLKTGHPITKALLEARGVRGALSWLDSTKTDEDGRVRCSFSNPGSETGRVLSKTWFSGSGGNLQAVSSAPINFRTLLRADEGMTMAQCDLKGADGWTVAARCAQLGDRTMMDDLAAGIRIPSLLSLLMGGASFPSSMPREDIRKLCKGVVKDWRDYAFKKAQHLSNYMGSASLIQRETVRESWSETGTPIDPGLPFVKRVQDLYLQRYWGLRQWWNDVERQVRRDGTLRGASGQVREFLSRRWQGVGAARRLDHQCLKEAIASEPQMVTTYATNLALWRLWTDPANCRSDGTHIIIPSLHIHDALLVQFPTELVGWAGAKLNEWFTNPLRVGNLIVSIPVDAKHGSSWGTCNTPFPPFPQNP